MTNLANLSILVRGEHVTDNTLRDIADTRARMHRSSRQSRPLSESHELIGLLGEREFSAQSGLPMNIAILGSGDQGNNFTTPGGSTIDVSTYRNPVHLLREAEKPAADIHVLAQVHADLSGAVLLGWEYDRIMLLCPKRTMPGYEIVNHIMLADDLRPMQELMELIAEERDRVLKYG